MRATGVGLGQLLLALDATVAHLVDAPRGLDLPVSSATLIDSDDVRLGLAPGAGSADVFFLLGVAEGGALEWIEAQTGRPVAIFIKQPSEPVVARAVAAGIAVVAVDPRARWERLYRLVHHVLEHHGDHADPVESDTDLFGLAQAVANRTHGMVSIEDAQSHVLAYSASEEADELRRLSILGRAGPPEHLEWIAKAGIFDALRAEPTVVRVGRRPELGLQPRLAIGIHRRSGPARRAPEFVGTIWVQQGSHPLADDAEQVLHGAAVLAERIMARLAARPSTRALRVQQLLGLAEPDDVDLAVLARELGVRVDGRAAVIGFHGAPADVIALSATAFRFDAQVTSVDDRVYVVLPQTPAPSTVASWVRGTVAALRRELHLELRAVIAAPLVGLAAAASARAGVDRVFDSAGRHPAAIAEVTSLDEARTTVLLDEIVGRIDDRLVDPRVRALREQHPLLADTLRVYLDSFGDIAAAAAQLQVHPNTVRYRVRRVEKLLSMSLADPDVRLVISLSLRATER
ncbi:PucR family transcriptional regulator [Mycobacterium talmoniae]|uniref:Transcriptional regulator n=1 Tax=Mycobacterium talmoniae TaxID=1858794 RepID=A0A1S1N0Z1_9MYCO|nr:MULTISPECIES: helix-turn-helix domain-containing protein [Mycobacterium]OHU93331.1 transcriptional regulator [Mycobacterium talmoniae]TDH52468.1 PucR family transcriptional regulator [Mycobacterium eburneum]